MKQPVLTPISQQNTSTAQLRDEPTIPLGVLMQAVESGHLGFAKVDAEAGTFQYANSAFCDLVGFSFDQLVADAITVKRLLHPEDFARCIRAWERLRRGELSHYTMQKRCITKDRAVIPVSVTTTGLTRLDDGTVGTIGLIVARLDAGERQRGGIPNGASFWVYDFISEAGDCSDGFKLLLGRPLDGPRPSFRESIVQVHPEDRRRVTQDVLRAQKGLCHSSEFRIHRLDGELRWVGQSVTPVIDGAGAVIGVIGCCLDITDAKRLAKHTPSSTTVQAAQRYVDQHWSRPLTITDLAAAAGVNARTLFKHFRLARGCTPQEYIKRVRLNHARALLQAGDRSTTVLGTALKCCFQNQGHFARDYRLAFGERPSDTLERARRIETP